MGAPPAGRRAGAQTPRPPLPPSARSFGARARPQDRAWREEAGKGLLVKIFDSLGGGHDLVKRGRRKLANLLFN